MSIKKRLIYGSVFFAELLGCAPGQVKTNKPLNITHPGAIELSLELADKTMDSKIIGQQAIKNLQDWHFPIGLPANQPVTHNLTVNVGSVERGSTPAGFSFSSGNSDPRALDFQKADVLPITCSLNSVQQPDHTAELSMGFSDTIVTQALPNPREVANHVSTVCFNLLREVDWPISLGQKTEKLGNTGWMPEIRIETQESMSKQPLPDKTTVAPNTGQSEEQSQKPAVKEITKEGRKIYIIHNQGSPVTFQFGNDRK
jgi:hypothetical protein